MSVLIASGLAKMFTMHLRGGIALPVIANASFALAAGECAVLDGPSGVGKSSILKMLYGNYAASTGKILVQHGGQPVDLVSASPRTILEIRRDTIGYVSQFLRVVPRVSARDIVAEPLVERGADRSEAIARAGELLSRLNLPDGEQQRVNIARSFVDPSAIMLIDEPTASLDAANRAVVIDMIRKKKSEGVALLGIFHDAAVRDEIADALIAFSGFAPARKTA